MTKRDLGNTPSTFNIFFSSTAYSQILKCEMSKAVLTPLDTELQICLCSSIVWQCVIFIVLEFQQIEIPTAPYLSDKKLDSDRRKSNSTQPLW